MNCPTCNRQYSEGLSFCPTDGAQLRAESEKTDPLIGTLLDGRYRVIDVLGRGGMGVVYRALQVKVDREVAVKVIRPAGSDREDAVRRFEREAKIVSTLRHPNTLKLIDFGHTDGGMLYIVNPLLQGRPLDVVLAEEGRLTPARTLHVLAQLCDALIEAHELGIVHRDLKPANIFIECVGEQEVVKILDFGIAKLTVDAVDQTAQGSMVGTPAYMSPEQIRAEASVDGRADIYSLGVVAYECLCGRQPFAGLEFMAIALRHLHETPLSLQSFTPTLGLDARVDELVLRMLEKLPEDRYPDAATLRKAIDQVERRLALPPEPGPRDAAATPDLDLPSEATFRRSFGWKAGLLVFGAGLAWAGGWALWREPSPGGETLARPSGVAVVQPAVASLVIERAPASGPAQTAVQAVASPRTEAPPKGATSSPQLAGARPPSSTVRPTPANLPGRRPETGTPANSPGRRPATAAPASSVPAYAPAPGLF